MNSILKEVNVLLVQPKYLFLEAVILKKEQAPWWMPEYSTAIEQRDKTFKTLKKIIVSKI